MKWLIVALLCASVAWGCIVPTDRMVISRDTTLCADVYYLDHGISINESNIHLDCSGALLKSWKGGIGISIEHLQNVTVTGCHILNYDTGFYVRNSSSIFLIDNHLVRNIEGTRFVVVSNSATYNNDVSLNTSLTVLGSKENILTLTNRPVEGDFCHNNYCNKKKDVVEFSMKPETSVEDLHKWLFGELNPKKSLLDMLLEDLSREGFFLR